MFEVKVLLEDIAKKHFLEKEVMELRLDIGRTPAKT
jgi:hypothetical protein